MSSPSRTGQLPQTRLSSSMLNDTGSFLISFWYKPESAVTKPMNQVYENTQGHCTEGLQQTIWRTLPYKIISHLSSELESNWCPEASLTLLPEILPDKAIPLCPCGILILPTFWISVVLLGACRLRTFFNAMILPSKPLFREEFLIHILYIIHSLKTIFIPFGLTHLPIQRCWSELDLCFSLESPVQSFNAGWTISIFLKPHL